MHWSKPAVSGDLPPPLWKHTTTLVANKLYTFGVPEGQDDKRFGEPWIFDTETMHWSKPKVYGETPLHNKAHTAGSIGKNIYLFGGGDNSQYFNDLLVFDTETLTWSAPKTQGDRPSSRRALCSGVIGNTFYIFGGGDGQSPLNDLYSLNTDTLTWKKHVGKKGKFWPSPRGYHSGTVVGDKFYILGGSNITTCFNDAVIFDSKTESWSVRTPIEPKCRYAHSANLIGPYIFVFGGCDGFSYVETLDLLNLKTQTWENPSITGTPPPARGYHTATFHDNRLFIIGGNCGDTSFGDVYILDLGVYAYLPLQQFLSFFSFYYVLELVVKHDGLTNLLSELN